MKVISLVNQKGGVAKTTTSIALADGLARRGKRVLIIDFDPQAHLTTSFALSDDAQCPQALRFLNIVPGAEFQLQVINKNLSIVTSEIGLEQANTILQTKIGRERFLARAIKKLSTSAFDYVIIDSNPSLSILTVNVLAASDYILIPFKPEFNSFKGVDLLLESVSDVKTMYPQIEILGFIVTMADKRRRSTAESIEIIEQKAQQSGTCVFKSIIRVAVQGADAASHGKSIYEYAPTSKISDDYEKLCDEILAKLNEKEI